MKIAFFITQFPSLSQTFVLNQITGLLDRGHEVEIFARNPGDDPKVHQDVIDYNLLAHTHYFLKIPYSRIKRTIRGAGLVGRYVWISPGAIFNSLNLIKHGADAASLALLYQTISFLSVNDFDVIHCHFGPNGANAVRLRQAGVIKGKIVTVFHGYDLTSYLARGKPNAYGQLFDKGDLFQPISHRWEKKLIEMGCDSRKITVHRMGIEVDGITPMACGASPRDRIRILSVARLVEKKGIEYGIQAVSKLVQTKPEVEYLIVGDGPLKPELSGLIDRLRMNEHIKLMGWMNQAETFAFMQQSDIFLAPSVTSQSGDQEGIPVVLMEAMAHGLPVVSTRHSGIPELVFDNQTGVLVGEQEVDELAEKIDRLISSPDLLKKFGHAGRQVVEEQYNTRLLNEELERTFLKLTEK